MDEIGFVSHIWIVGQTEVGVNWVRFAYLVCGGFVSHFWHLPQVRRGVDWVRFAFLVRGDGGGGGELGSFCKFAE